MNKLQAGIELALAVFPKAQASPVCIGLRQPGFFNVCSKTLIPSWAGDCHFGKSLGSTPQKTSYKSTLRGLVYLAGVFSRSGAGGSRTGLTFYHNP
jgi:hypothetical protein